MAKFKFVLREHRTTDYEKRVEIEAPTAEEALKQAGAQVWDFTPQPIGDHGDMEVSTDRDFTVMEDLGNQTNYDEPLMDSFNGPQDEAVAKFLKKRG